MAQPRTRLPISVTLDLSELHSISRLALIALRILCRGVVRTGGRVRLAQKLQPEVKEALTRAELLDLFEAIPDAQAAVKDRAEEKSPNFLPACTTYLTPGGASLYNSPWKSYPPA